MATAPAHPWRAELRDQVRAFSGAVLFGIPLLYTMEVWWVGTHTSAVQMAAILSGTFAVVLLLNHIAGFRDSRDVALHDLLMDSVEAVAMGILASVLILAVTREISAHTPAAELLGKIVYHAVTASIGVALAAQFFRGAADVVDDEANESSALVGTVIDLGASAIGATFVVSAIAPTDEIPMLTAALSPAWLLVLIVVSLLVSYAVVFASGFAREAQRRVQPGVLQHPVTETVAAYLVALAVSTVALVLFQRISLSDPYAVWAPQVLVLGLPGAIGGAAGRLAV